jgi:small GTP-binding protein
MNEFKIPLVALIGLPNAGKSTLINRLSDGKKAIVAKEAHTTRDLNYGECEWDGKYFRIVDTGGLVPDAEGKIQKAVQIKSWGAIAEADMLVWLIDCKQDTDTISLDIIQRIWKTGKPFIICLNKVDDPNLDRSIADYAKLGGEGFINVSCNIGYGLGDLCDMIIGVLEKHGFSKHLCQKPEIEELKKAKPQFDRRLKNVEKALDGTYIIRGTDGIFESVNAKEEEIKENKIENLVFDWYRVVFSDSIDEFVAKLIKKYKLNSDLHSTIHKLYLQRYEREISGDEFSLQLGKLTGEVHDFDNDLHKMWSSMVKEIPSTTNFIKYQKSLGKRIYYITNIGNTLADRRASDIFKYFDGGIASCEVDLLKPDPQIYKLLLETYNIKATNSVFIDDKPENVRAAQQLGFKGITYFDGETDLDEELKKLEGKNPNPPKVLFLGKPNVGKSSLFNAMVGEDIQIVTDIAGTTLSVNDTLVTRQKKFKRKVPIKSEFIDQELSFDM